MVNTAASALVGFVVGGVIATAITHLPFGRSTEQDAGAGHH
jgi:hypothetical protein